MAIFEDPLTGDFPSRVTLDEDEKLAEPHVSRYFVEPEYQVGNVLSRSRGICRDVCQTHVTCCFPNGDWSNHRNTTAQTSHRLFTSDVQWEGEPVQCDELVCGRWVPCAALMKSTIASCMQCTPSIAASQPNVVPPRPQILLVGDSAAVLASTLYADAQVGRVVAEGL